MTQIESAALAWISLAIAGNAIFAIALSSTDSAIPTARFRIAQYLSGSGSPSSAVFIMQLTYGATPACARSDNVATARAHGRTVGEGEGYKPTTAESLSRTATGLSAENSAAEQ